MRCEQRLFDWPRIVGHAPMYPQRMEPDRNRTLIRLAVGGGAIAVLVIIGLLVALVLVLGSQVASQQAQSAAGLDTADTAEPAEGPRATTAPPVPAATTSAAPAATAPAAPAPPAAPACPQGGVKIVYNKVWISGGFAYGAGGIGNQSDTPVQIFGHPGAWGVDANGVNVIPVGAEWRGRVDYVLPGQTVGFVMSSGPLTAEQVGAVAQWRYAGDGPYLSARWLVGPECTARPGISLEVLN